MSEPRPDTPDTGAGTPLTADEEAALRTDLRVAGPHDFPQRGLVARLFATLDAARSRPATDPAGLDAIRALKWLADETVAHMAAADAPDSLLDAERHARYVLARLSVADGPGPEERPDLDQVTIIAGALKGTYWTEFKEAEDDDWRADAEFVLARFQEYGFQLAALSRPLPENREEPSR